MRNGIFIIAITLLFACQNPTKKVEETSSHVMVNDSKINLVDLENKPLKLPQGKVLILNLWATWCKPCIEEMPSLAEMVKRLPESHKLILASDEPLNRINAFVSARTLDLQFAQITSSVEELGVYSLPTTLIINSNGEVLETLVGARDWNTQEQIDYLTTFKP